VEFGNTWQLKVELWSPTGGVLADITPLVQELEYTLTRNAATQVTFQLDLTTFEVYCVKAGVNPETAIAPYQSDVRIKCNGTYVCDPCQITGLEFDLQTNDTGVNPETGSYNNTTTITETITVTATGYLNILMDRYYTGAYTNEDSCSIAVDLVNQAQLLTNGNVGITFAPDQYTTGFLYSPTYTQQQILSELGNLTQLPGALFDLWLDENKVLHTAALQGNRRNDIALTYGGAGSNITGLYHQRTAAGALYNDVIGMGSGFGADALTSVQGNATSQLDYFLRQSIQQFNNVTNQSQLDQDTAAELAMSSQPLDIPQLILTGKELEGLPLIGAGDRIVVNFPTHPIFGSVSGQWFRAEQVQYSFDDNQFPFEITITADQFGFEQGQ
jgi:hypothetical protein